MKKRPEKGPGIPISAMVDVVFLLLVYFIVTYRETIPEAHLAANLPSPVPTEFLAEQLLPLELEIHPDEYRVRGRPHPLATVQSILAYTAEHDKNVTVIIKTSQQAPAKRLVTLLDACNRVGLHDLNVVALGK